MKIVYLVPGLMPDKECRRREGMLRAWAAAGTLVDVAAVDEGPFSIESQYEEALAVPATARLAVQKEQEGYDAAIVGCAGDPGLEAIRELMRKMAVFGPGATSFLAAAMLGNRFAVLAPEGEMTQSNRLLAIRAGVLDKLAGTVSMGLPVLSMMNDRGATLQRMLDASRRAVSDLGADTLVIGCMTLAFLDFSRELEQATGLPVVNPASSTLKITEAMVACGLAPSRAAFPLPPKMKDPQNPLDFSALYGKRK